MLVLLLVVENGGIVWVIANICFGNVVVLNLHVCVPFAMDEFVHVEVDILDNKYDSVV